MKIAVQQFLQQHHIPFIDRGPNVGRGNVNIHCPFCGGSDPSKHLGVHLETGKWGCWRDPDHRGNSFYTLVRALLRCSEEQAKEITKRYSQILVEADELAVMVEGLDSRNEVMEEKVVKPLEFPQGVCFVREEGVGSRFFNFLRRRGFRKSDIPGLCDYYKLHGVLIGEWKDRLIIPFYIYDQLVGWAARAIAPTQIRYKVHPVGSQLKRVLFNYSRLLEGGEVLVIVEGPLDVLKVDYYGKDAGYRSVPILGTSASSRQIALLARVARKFDKILILLDQAAESQAFKLQSSLVSFNPKVVQLPEGVDDPGDLLPEVVVPFIDELL